MPDYLQPLNNGLRRVMAVVCLVAAVLSAAVTGIVVTAMFQTGEVTHKGKPVWVGAVVLAFIALSCGFFTVRLGSGRLANGVTVLPVWFIEVFGVLLLVGVSVLAVAEGFVWGIATVINVAVAMILIRRAVRRRAAFETVE
ncbi:hypothetical protein [Limnoglobus roseus]|uniref:Uncharacterized protein n=1 Tax=Limnoglobus roseus TaxID=2598579 RepID=A0A5C1AG03_9BACT|nr:hypothetical protein [Limnoglobus roseus]QEL17163.1 hypothetical protein PX52LOC_04145 [Limnoglobus roseus]